MVFITNTNGADEELIKKENKTEIEKEYLLFRSEFHEKEYEKIFNRMCSNTDNVMGRAFMAYKRCLDNIISDYNNELINFLSGDEVNLSNKGKLPIKNYTDNTTFNAIVNKIENEKLEIDLFYLRFINKLNTETDYKIKEFPKDTDKQDKELLEKLAKEPLINPKLNNGKFDEIFGSKPIARFLIRNNITASSGFVFF